MFVHSPNRDVSLNQGTRKLNKAPRLNQISSDQGGFEDWFTQIQKYRPTGYQLASIICVLVFPTSTI